ncbi:zinc finger protein 208-like [Anopheles maculipalpis]|uniref:zinc finger protein 208-like n=1 Tax=Anopheles maculipalpis TaxID=1496333 RepID=UPI00215952D7|nr:zinc finger protein 208-like [Anopheles maculipalpis]
MALESKENFRAQCDVCLRDENACFANSDPIFEGKNVLALVAQHLDIEIKLTSVCQPCWTRLEEFDEFYRMVNEQHQHNDNGNHHNKSDPPDDTKDPVDPDPSSMFGMEFVEIKQEPLGEEDRELDVAKEEREQLADLDDCGQLSTESNAGDNDGEENPMHDDSGSASSDESDDSYRAQPATYKKSSTKQQRQPSARKELKVDTEILEFYKRLVCEVCDAERMLAGKPSIEYGNLRELNKHMRKAHDQAVATMIKCPLCDKKFRYRGKMIEHRDMHLYPERFRCVVCQEVHQNMAEHMKNKHQERTYCCDECGKRFPFKARLTAHVKKMHTTKDVVCDQCQKSFSKYTIEDHKRAVHESKFICEHCPRTFKSRFSLEQHMEEHVQGLRKSTAATCDKCGVVLRDKYTLQSHIKRMHTEHAPVSCVSCGKVFKSKQNLNAHLANVCTERSFPCPICEKQFKKKIKLKEHMTTHTKSALYQCPYCTKTFSFETQLYTHRKQAHYEQWLEMQRKRKEGVRFKVNWISDAPAIWKISYTRHAMAMEIKCEVCLSATGCEFKEIFIEENKHIVAIIAKHLWFELAETTESSWLCGKCWNALKEFHKFYCDVETARRRQESPTLIDKEEDDDDEEEVSGGSTEPKYRTEFFEVKVEPLELLATGEEEDVHCSDEKALHCAFVKCEEPLGLDPTAPTSDDELGNRSDCSSGDDNGKSRLEKRSSKKLPPIDDQAKQSKAIAQKQEDESLHGFYKRIVCEECDNQRMMVGEPQIDFGTWRALLRHTKEVHRHDKVYVKCPLCELKLRTKQTLLQHKDCHENPEKYRCMLCGEIHQNMKEHLQNKHQERQFCCDVCGKKFPFKKRLTVHMKKMHVEKDIICEQCQKPFTKYTIEDHKRSVHSARFVCEHCPKTFNSRFRLHQHMEEHDESLRNSTSVPCTICGQVMRDKYILTRHIKLMHTVQPSVSCTTCGKTFKCKRNLSVHMTNVCLEPTRLFPCTICGKEFRRKNKLKEHMSTHTGKPVYKCSFCPETFRQDTHLYYHRKNAHYEQWLEMQQQRKEGVRFKLTELT